MSEERIPFDYDKYAADPNAWKLYDGNDDQVVAVFRSYDPGDNYDLKGIVQLGHVPADRPQYMERTWTTSGMYSRNDSESLLNIVSMEPVEVKKPVVPTVKLHTPAKLRNLYYDAQRNRVTMSMSDYTDYESAQLVAAKEIKSNPDKEHLCVFSMADHPQIREVLIARGLAEVELDDH